MTKIIISITLLLVSTVAYSQQEVELLNEGIVFPRINTADRSLLTPIAGQCIYNLDMKSIECYDGADWVAVQLALRDSDGDTRLEVEKFPDVDALSVTTNGLESWRFWTNGNGRPTLEIYDPNQNVLIGQNAGLQLDLAFFNVALGQDALTNNIVGNSNTALGAFALNKVTSSNNTGIGTSALFNLQTGNNNIGIGSNSLSATTHSNDNIAIGVASLQSNASFQNVALGSYSLSASTTGQGNTALGFQALSANNGNQNIAIGTLSGPQSPAVSDGIFIGTEAGRNEISGHRMHIGPGPGPSMIVGYLDQGYLQINAQLGVPSMNVVSSGDQVVTLQADGSLAARDNLLRVSSTGDTLYNGANYVIIPGISDANAVMDCDGNTYTSVVIGTQEWMVENLRTTCFNDGTPIYHASSATQWDTLTQPGYCWYANDSTTYADPYGAIYNDAAAQSGNVCPIGWHVPTDVELAVLESYLGSDTSPNGGSLKETGFTHWNAPNVSATNSSGFTLVGAGFRNPTGSFGNINVQSAMIMDHSFSGFSVIWEIFTANDMTRFTPVPEGVGGSIRCLRD